MIIFNINALAQAIILALIFGIFYLLNINEVSVWTAYIPFLTVILTYRIGLKGKFFWVIPTWIIATFIMFFYVKEHFYDNSVSNNIYLYLNYLILIYISYRMIFDGSKLFKKEFLNANLILKNINKTDSYFENNKKEFWAQITHTFVRPSFFYKNLNSVYSLIFRDMVSQKEFIDHNILLIDTIKDRLTISSNYNLLSSRANYLRANRENTDFNYAFVEELAKSIDLEVKSL